MLLARRLLPLALALAPYLGSAVAGHSLFGSAYAEEPTPHHSAAPALANGCSTYASVKAGQTFHVTINVTSSDPNDPNEGEALTVTVSLNGSILLIQNGFGSNSVSPTASADGDVVGCVSGAGNDGDETIAIQVTADPIKPDENKKCDPSDPGVADGQGSCADPINTATGDFARSFVDFNISGRGFPLLVMHTYNSLDHANNGPLGYGWTFGPLLTLQTGSSSATVYQEEGSAVHFTLTNGSYVPPRYSIATLTHNGDGTWTFTRLNRETFTFSSAGALLSAKNRNGYATTFSYNGSGQLSSITDTAGRSITVSWSGSHIASLSEPSIPDPSNLGHNVTYAVSFSYDANGNLSQVVDQAGNTTQFSYDSNHLLLTITDPRGYVLQNAYDSQGRVTAQTVDPTGLNRTTTISYTANADGTQTTQITDPQGNVTQDVYMNGLLLSRALDVNSNDLVTTYGYDLATYQPISITAPGNRVTTYAWDSNANPTQMTDPMGRTTIYQWDAQSDLLSQTDAMGTKTSYTYDANGNVLTRSTPLAGTSQSQTMTYTYGDTTHPGDVTSVTDAAGHTWTFTYDSYGDRNSATDPAGNKTTYAYNALGWLASKTTPKGNISGGTPSAYTTTYGHDPFGDVTTVTDPLGHTTTRHYDGDRNMDSYTDAGGRVTHYTYDAANEHTTTTRPDGAALQWQYDGDGNITQRIDANGNATSFGYDGVNRLTFKQDPAGHYISALYNGTDLTQLTDSQQDEANYTYDNAGELTSALYVGSGTADVPIRQGWNLLAPDTYGAYSGGQSLSGLVDSIDNAVGSSSAVKMLATYQNGRYSLYVPGFSDDASLNSTQGVFVLSATAGTWAQSGSTLSTGTDTPLSPGWNLISEPFPLSGLDESAIASALSSATNCNLQEIATYTGTGYAVYTPGGTSRHISATDGMWILCGTSGDLLPSGYGPDITAMAYDNDGRLTSMSDGTGTSTWTYDSLGRVTHSTDGAGDAVSYAYDLNNNLTGITYPGNHTVTRAFDAAGRMQSVSDWLGNTTTFAYDANGNLTSETFPSGTGIVDTFGFDAADRLMSITDAKGGSTLASFTYGRSAADQITSAATTGLSQPAQTFTYDALQQLQSLSTGGGAAQSYTIDPAGNLTGLPNGTTLTYDTADELQTATPTSGPAVTYTYDAAGRRSTATPATGSPTTYTYDALNRLTGYNDWSYTYNGFGLRAAKTHGTSTESYVWSMDGGLPHILQDGSTSYVYGPNGMPLEQISPSNTVLYYHQDAVGSTRMLTDAAGTVAATYSYDPFGNVTAKTGTVTNPFGFAGQYTDAESGLIYLRGRYYDPGTGSFLTVDPLVGQTLTPYAYTHNDPVNRVDPTGYEDSGSSGAGDSGNSDGSGDSTPSSGIGISQEKQPFNSAVDINPAGQPGLQGQVVVNDPHLMIPKVDSSGRIVQPGIGDLTTLQLNVNICSMVKGQVSVTPDGKNPMVGVQVGNDNISVTGQVNPADPASGQVEVDGKAGPLNAGVQVSHDSSSGWTTGVSVGGSFNWP